MDFCIDVENCEIRGLRYSANRFELNFEYDEDDLFEVFSWDEKKIISKIDKIHTYVAVWHFGKDELLEEIGIDYVKKYFNLTEIE